MNDKKILLITPDFPPKRGGVARYLSALASYLKDDVEVVAAINQGWQAFDPNAGYPIFRRELLSKWGWPRWRKTVKYLKQYSGRYRLILTSHVLPYGSAAMVAARKTKTPYIVFVHGMDIRLAQQSSRKRAVAKKVLMGARLVVCNSNALAKEVARVFKITDIIVVYPCLESVPELPEKATGTFTLTTVARLVERKGHTHVLNALAHLRGTGQLIDFVYNIVGEGPMEKTLKGIVSALSLGQHVTFHGNLDDESRNTLYARSNAFVMPVSKDPVDKEGFGLVFLEAAQFGVPSITTRIEGVDEAVIDGETGILLNDQNEERLAEAILLLAKQPETSERMGDAARERSKEFSCEKQFEKLKPYLV